MGWQATAFVKSITTSKLGLQIERGEKLVLLLLADYIHPETGIAYPSLSRLAEEALYDRRSIIRIIESLEEKGFISVERSSDRKVNKYSICGLVTPCHQQKENVTRVVTKSGQNVTSASDIAVSPEPELTERTVRTEKDLTDLPSSEKISITQETLQGNNQNQKQGEPRFGPGAALTHDQGNCLPNCGYCIDTRHPAAIARDRTMIPCEICPTAGQCARTGCLAEKFPGKKIIPQRGSFPAAIVVDPDMPPGQVDILTATGRKTLWTDPAVHRGGDGSFKTLFPEPQEAPGASDRPGTAHTPKKEHQAPRKPQNAKSIPLWVPLDAWEGFLDMRSAKRAKPTERAKDLILKELERLSSRDSVLAGKILDQSTVRGWLDVFPYHGDKPAKGPIEEPELVDALELKRRKEQERKSKS